MTSGPPGNTLTIALSAGSRAKMSDTDIQRPTGSMSVSAGSLAFR